MILSSQLGRAKGAIGASLLIFVALGCDEEGKTAPETCASPPLEIYDIQDPPSGEGGAGAGVDNPCLTKVGHAVSPSSEIAGSSNGGSSNGGRSNGGSSNGGSSNSAGAGGASDAEAGAGGA
jgi:hypothetical protein